MKKFILYSLFLIALLPLQVGGFEERAGFLNDPCLEWDIAWDGAQENPFDVVASAVFTHPSGDKRVTGMYYAGNHRWQFRYTGTKTGKWTFQTQGPGGLGGKSGVVIIKESPNGRQNGFITHFGNKWGWEGTGKAFIPQYVMGKDMQYYYDFKNNRVDEGKIEQDIKEFIHEHGFTGFHLRLDRAWFDIKENLGKKRNPDVRTFAVLETILQKVYQHGGACHLWMWGKDKNKNGDGPRAIVGGPMSQADRRILRYIAARLGPLPGWSVGYGYDTENLWASPKELTQWKAYLETQSGWDHFIGARVGFDEKGLYGRYGKGIPKPPLNDKYNAPIGDDFVAWLGGDYIGYTSYRPFYDRYVKVLNHQPTRPSFEEDRFRIRKDANWTHKDYDADMTLRGLWHSAMAGGVANIWGHLIPNDNHGGSQTYDYHNVHIKKLINTYATFFRDKQRFRKDFVRDNSLADAYEGTTETPDPASISVCLRNPAHSHYIFYKEKTALIGMDLSEMDGNQPAVAVDTRKAYKEIDLGELKAENQRWQAPYKSNWAIAVGNF